jgi:hypothetical protein
VKSVINKKKPSDLKFSVSRSDIEMINNQGERNNLLNFRANIQQKNELKQSVFSSVQPKRLSGYYDKMYDFEI